jgi:hypothetical protein
MDRRSRRRILKIEDVLSAAQKKRKEEEEKFLKNCLSDSRYHATAVAAILLSGSPSVNEPLSKAWGRALQHYNLSVSFVPGSLKDQVMAAQRLFPTIMAGKLERARFAEIFRTVPDWLRTFTGLILDRRFLKFDLAQAKQVPNWGTIGYDQSRRWPLLPSGTMTDGDPVPNEKAELWPFPLDFLEQAIFDIENNRPQQEEVSYSSEQAEKADSSEQAEKAEFLENFQLLFALENPQEARGLPRHQRLRLSAFLKKHA